MSDDQSLGTIVLATAVLDLAATVRQVVDHFKAEEFDLVAIGNALIGGITIQIRTILDELGEDHETDPVSTSGTPEMVGVRDAYMASHITYDIAVSNHLNAGGPDQ